MRKKQKRVESLVLIFNFAVHLLFDMVMFLSFTSGADVNRATTNNDHTVLSLACAGGHLSVVELLLNHNADPSHKLKVKKFKKWRIRLNFCLLSDLYQQYHFVRFLLILCFAAYLLSSGIHRSPHRANLK